MSFSDVINNKTEETTFKNKLVFIGATSPDLHDNYFVPTSLGHAMPGVEIHANSVQTIINKDFLYYENIYFVIITIAIFCLITCILIYCLKVWIAFIWSFVLILIYNLISIYLFEHGIIMNLVYPTIIVIFTFVAYTSLLYILEEKNKKWITEIFGKYVSPEVVKELMKNPKLLKLGGEKKEMTILFSDIRNFTSFSEKMQPHELVLFLNDFLSEMTNIILKNSGLVDKYMGDAIMAMWNVPKEDKNHTKKACMTALLMKEKMIELQMIYEKRKCQKLILG